MSLESLSVLESKVASMIEVVAGLRQERQSLLDNNSLLQSKLNQIEEERQKLKDERDVVSQKIEGMLKNLEDILEDRE